MAEPIEDEIASQITRELESTKYACSSLTRLSGGTANFIFKGKLQKPLEDGTSEVAVKHGEGFVAQHPSLKLSLSRCHFEGECLQAMQKLPPTTNKFCSVRTPRLFHFNPGSSTQIQEYFPNSLDLKTYALKHFSPSTPESQKPKIREIGRSLGEWLRSFHGWAASPEQETLRARVKMNQEMQAIKLTYNYERLLWQLEEFPAILKEAKPIFEEVIAKVRSELVGEGSLRIIHGDFWTGNILLPDAEISTKHQMSLFVIDWEMCQLGVAPLDLGQMIAELYELTLYKDIEAGLWIVEGFVAGYGFVDEDFEYRTAIHVGAHLVCFGSNVPGWGSDEQRENVMKTGRDIILRACEKDRGWFEDHDLVFLCKGR